MGDLVLKKTTTGQITLTPQDVAGNQTVTIPAANGTIALISSNTLTLGTQSSAQGSLILANTNAGNYPLTIQSSNSSSAAWSFVFPATAGTNGYALTTNGSGVTSWTSLVNQSSTAPNNQIYTSGSGTYTVPAGVKWLRVRMIGGGGGGSGSGNAGGQGGTGGNTTFGSSTASGGVGGVCNNVVGGTGGAASISGGAGISLQGGYGGACMSSSAAGYIMGGNGGVSPFGGAASGGGSTNFGNLDSYPAIANTGSGGGGGGGSGTTTFAGTGGGASGYIDMIISSPSATYSYAVGAGGTRGASGTSGYNGSAGGSGIIIIEEHYNW